MADERTPLVEQYKCDYCLENSPVNITSHGKTFCGWKHAAIGLDKPAYDFCNKMIKLFQLNDAFVMDLALIDNEYKIIECGCINCAGFYKANMQKLLMSLENSF